MSITKLHIAFKITNIGYRVYRSYRQVSISMLLLEI